MEMSFMELGQYVFQFVFIFTIGLSCSLYSYKLGIKRGWDDCAYALEDLAIIDIDEEGEILRVSDREYKKIKLEMNENN